MPRCAGLAAWPATLCAALRAAACAAAAPLLGAALPTAFVGLTAQAWPQAAQAQAVAAAEGQGLARNFPANALRGTVQVTQPPELLLNGRAARLSPGARIRGANNLLMVSGALVGQPLLVHYTTDALGQLHLVWVLGAEEAARKPWPTSTDQAQRWRFNPSEQRWTPP